MLSRGHLHIDGQSLECTGLWGDFPEALSQATGCGVFAYSRAGYGSSSPVSLPRPLSYMHDEARDILPYVLEQIDFSAGLLVGHSDGASIAALYAGSYHDDRVKGLVLMAPHVVVEDMTVTEIAKAKIAYETTDLKDKLARWHKDVDNAFYGWNGAWLDPEFRHWDITDSLPHIGVPVQVIQGLDDQYGTLKQVELIKAGCGGPVEPVLLPGVKHSPHREGRQATLEAMKAFAARTLRFAGDTR
jgi:pimeloyl-ACP methyl ester carboxylesterase